MSHTASLPLAGKPERIQLSRKRGWRMPENTVVVSRPSKWGNPWKVGEEYVVYSEGGKDITDSFSAAQCVHRFQVWLAASTAGSRLVDDAKQFLRGKNLACWCKPGTPCHADVLLELANGEPK